MRQTSWYVLMATVSTLLALHNIRSKCSTYLSLEFSCHLRFHYIHRFFHNYACINCISCNMHAQLIKNVFKYLINKKPYNTLWDRIDLISILQLVLDTLSNNRYTFLVVRRLCSYIHTQYNY